MPGQVTLTRRGVAWAVAAVLAFAVPFGVGALRGGDAAPAAATVLEPPALAEDVRAAGAAPRGGAARPADR